MVLDKKKTYKNLKKKGFVDSATKSIDHRYLEFYYNGRLICYTKVSHGSKGDIDDYLIRQMSTQCLLGKNDFADLVNCPLSQEAYVQILLDAGHLE